MKNPYDISLSEEEMTEIKRIGKLLIENEWVSDKNEWIGTQDISFYQGIFSIIKIVHFLIHKLTEENNIIMETPELKDKETDKYILDSKNKKIRLNNFDDIYYVLSHIETGCIYHIYNKMNNE